MIRLSDIRREFPRVFVVAGGPSKAKFVTEVVDAGLLKRTDLVIGTNRNSALMATPRHVTRISLSCDPPHVRNTLLPPGMIGVYVSADGEPPGPNLDGSSYTLWIPARSRRGRGHWSTGGTYLPFGIFMGGGSGYAALGLAELAWSGGEFHTYGFDGGTPTYDRLRENTDAIMESLSARIPSFTDHSERL